MKPHLEEAWRSLRLADRDFHAFDVLNRDADTYLSIVCFHAQQAIEKSLKAVLYAHQIEFRRTHDLSELTVIAPPRDRIACRRRQVIAVEPLCSRFSV